jgi:hypothetical protein
MDNLAERNSVEISVRGKWVKVPALRVGGNDLIVRGRWLKLAVIKDEDWIDCKIGNPDQYVKALKEKGSNRLRADIFTFTQRPPGTTPRYAYPLEWESIAVVTAPSFDDWWRKLPRQTRKNVRRSQKLGVTVKVCQLDDNLIRGLVELNNDSPYRQHKAFLHYGKSFDQVKKDQSTFLDRSEFIGAYFGKELIGFLKMVYRGEIASILQFLPKSSHSDKRPANALMAKAIEVCASRGFSYLTYGLFNYGHKGDCSLREFKIRNGFGEMRVPRFYVPLTMKGRVCMKLALHRGLLGILPPRVISLGVSARGNWHNFLQSTSRRSLMAERPGL